ncbi:pilus assembly protein PilM [Candidatus Riflebacteria bacterium]
MGVISKRYIESPYILIDFGTTQLRIIELEAPPRGQDSPQVDKVVKLLKIVDFPDFALEISGEERAGMSKAAYEEKLAESRNRFINKHLTEIIFENKIKLKNVVSIISDRSVSAKYLEVPKGKADELHDNVTKEAFRQMPFAMTNAQHTFRVLGEKRRKEDNAIILKIQFVILPDELLKKRVELLKSLDLAPEALLTMPTVLEHIAKPALAPAGDWKDKEDSPENAFRVLVVNIGYNLSSVFIFENGVFAFHRDITIGGNTINEEILKEAHQDERPLIPVDVEAMKREIGVLPEEYIDEISGERAEDKKFVARKTFEVTEKLLSNIQLSITYHLSTTGLSEDADVVPVEKIYLTGGGSNLKNIADFIEGSTEIPTELLDPCYDIKIPETSVNIEEEKMGLAPLVGASGFDWIDDYVDFWSVISPRQRKSGAGAAASIFSDNFNKIKDKILVLLGQKEEKSAGPAAPAFELADEDMPKVYGGIVGILTFFMLLRSGWAYKKYGDHQKYFKDLNKELRKVNRQNSKVIEAMKNLERAKARNNAFTKLKQMPLPWSQVLYEFSRLHNNSIYLENMEFIIQNKNELKFAIQLKARDKNSLFEYVDRLNTSPYFFTVDFPSGYQLVNISKIEGEVQEVYRTRLEGNIANDLRQKNTLYVKSVKESLQKRRLKYGLINQKVLSGAEIKNEPKTDRKSEKKG